MSHPELILLALLADGPSHPYGLVRRIRDMEVERWAAVAESTVYSVLRRLEEEGFLEGDAVPGDRGRPRTEYSLTPRGRRRLSELVREGLESPAPIHSDRLVAGVLAATAGEGARLESAAADVRKRRAAVAAARRRGDLSPQGRIILEFYESLADAHLEALRSLRDVAGGDGESPLPELPGDGGPEA